MASPSKISLKLLIHKKGRRVLFAEAGKDFVDFLFHILSMAVYSVVKIVSKDNMPGSLGRLYESIETMGETYLQPDMKISTILNPNTSNFSPKIPLLLASGTTASCSMRDLYRCNNNKHNCAKFYVTDDPRATCPLCYSHMNIKMGFVAGPSCAKDEKANEGGYVKGVVTYMIMDDLSVKPMSAISSINLLSTFNVKDFGAVEKKLVYVPMTQGVELLKTQCTQIQFLLMYFSPRRSLNGFKLAGVRPLKLM